MSDARTRPGAPRDLWPLLAAMGVLLVYNAPLLLMRGVGLGGDGIRQYYPAEYALANALRAGTLPFWTPELQAGFPLLAEGQPGALYPLNLLALATLPTPVAHNALIVVHQLVGLLGMFWWGRTLHFSGVGTALMALVFSLTTSLAGSDILLIETTAWIPFLFAVAERSVQRGSPWAVGWAIPLTGVQWLGGFPQIALYTLLATHIYVAGRVCTAPWSWSKRSATVIGWTVAALLGVALAAPQLVPQYELSQYSLRAGGIQGSLAAERSLFPGALITLVLPSWRTFLSDAGLGRGIYFSLLPCVLALALLLRPPRVAWFYPLLAVVIATTVLAFGHYSPLFPVIRRVPGFAYFRLPSRALVLSQFGLITMFGVAWDQWVAVGAAPLRRTVQRLLAMAVVLMAVNAIAAHPLRWLEPQIRQVAERYTQRHILTDPYHVQPPAYYQAKIDALYAALLDAGSLRRTEVVLSLAMAGVTWAVVRRWQKASPGLCAALILFDVLAAAGGLHAVDDRAWVTVPPSTVRWLTRTGADPACRMFWLVDQRAVTFDSDDLALLPANHNLLAGVPSTGLYAPLGFAAYYELMQRLGTVDLGFGYRPVSAEDVSADRALLDFLNVCYVLSRQPLAGFVELGRSGDVIVYHNDHALPRAFVVDQVEEVTSTAAAVAWVRAHPQRLADTVVLQGTSGVRLDPGAARAATVRVVDYQPSAVRIDVEAAGAVVLVISDTIYPGWHAQLDGIATPLHRANGVFRAVQVPAGTHRVEFEYTPSSFWRGVTTAAVATILFAAWTVVQWRIERSQSARP